MKTATIKPVALPVKVTALVREDREGICKADYFLCITDRYSLSLVIAEKTACEQ